MKDKNRIPNQDRREFILKAFSSCTLCCLAVPNLVASDIESNSTVSHDKHKFLRDSEMSMQAVYNFAFKWWYIPTMKNLMDQIGKKKFLDLLKKSSEKIQLNSKRFDNNYPVRSLSAWASYIKQMCENMDDVLTFEVVKENEKEFEIKCTECLFAKTFREAKASDIGYAGTCHQDYGMTKKFNPQLELSRKKTIMEGYDYCHFRWTIDE